LQYNVRRCGLLLQTDSVVCLPLCRSVGRSVGCHEGMHWVGITTFSLVW